MTGLRLARLPDRTPIKMTISILPDLAESLAQYASVYEQQYGQAESVADLIPYMLASFLENDRGFTRSTRK